MKIDDCVKVRSHFLGKKVRLMGREIRYTHIVCTQIEEKNILQICHMKNVGSPYYYTPN